MKTLNDFIYAAAGQYLCTLDPLDKAIEEKQEDILIYVESTDHWEPFEHYDSEFVCEQIQQTASAFFNLVKDDQNEV